MPHATISVCTPPHPMHFDAERENTHRASQTREERPATLCVAAWHPPDGRCVYWCLLLVLGFAYVAMVLCKRATPFASGNNAWRDWLCVQFSGPALYLL